MFYVHPIKHVSCFFIEDTVDELVNRFNAYNNNNIHVYVESIKETTITLVFSENQ